MNNFFKDKDETDQVVTRFHFLKRIKITLFSLTKMKYGLHFKTFTMHGWCGV